MTTGLIDAKRVCRSLKTKMFYVTGFEEEQFRPSATAQYWCVQTMTQVGPDDRLVVPERCCEGRTCWRDE